MCLTHTFTSGLIEYFISGLAQYFLFHSSTLHKAQTISLIDGRGATAKFSVCVNTYWKPDWQSNKFLFHLNQGLDLFTNISLTHNVLMTVRLDISATPQNADPKQFNTATVIPPVPRHAFPLSLPSCECPILALI